MSGIGIYFQFIGGCMLGIEFVPNTRSMLVDLLIVRVVFEYITEEDLENDE
jgi:hypothetical protein